jgi:hypothetical protein
MIELIRQMIAARCLHTAIPRLKKSGSPHNNCGRDRKMNESKEEASIREIVDSSNDEISSPVIVHAGETISESNPPKDTEQLEAMTTEMSTIDLLKQIEELKLQNEKLNSLLEEKEKEKAQEKEKERSFFRITPSSDVYENLKSFQVTSFPCSPLPFPLPPPLLTPCGLLSSG